MLQCLYVGIGGFIGAICRYLFSLIPINNGHFPLATLLINLIGAILIGVITETAGNITRINENMLLFLKVGFAAASRHSRPSQWNQWT